jgi:uncharacterized protein (TIGR03435 family)
MSPVLRYAALSILASAAAPAQPPPAFDVASVTPAKGQRTSGYSHQITPTSLTMLHVSMGHCLRLAYDIRTAYELVGPAWLDPPTESEYDVVAKVDRPVSQDTIRAMLRTLLEARFQLRAHRETRELPVYALVVTKSSPSLHPSTTGDTPKQKSGDKPYQMLFQHYSMAQFALQLGPPWTARPVIDRTGLAGSYDFELDTSRYVVDQDSGKPILDYRGAIDMEGALVRALPEQLGLALKPQPAPYDVLVVDHVEKVPSAN